MLTESDRALDEIPACDAEDLKANALHVLGRLRSTIGLVIHATTNKGLHNSRDLQNELGVDRNLSWQIFKMLGPVDTLSILPYVPAAVSMKKLLSVIKKRGVPMARITEAESAFASFESFVRTSANNRDRLETMLMSFTDSDEGRQVDLQHRKAAYRAHSHFYGIEVDTAVQTLIYYPGSSSQRVSCIGLQQVSGMRRLRLDNEIVVSRLNMIDDSNDHKVMRANMVDVEAAERYGAPVIEEFCSKPMPDLGTVVDPSGMARTVLASRKVGSAADIDLAFGRAWLDLPMNVDVDGYHALSAQIAIVRPTQVIIGDVFLHRSTFKNVAPSSGLWAQVGGAENADDIERRGVRLPMREEFSYVGTGEDVARLRELPRYAELVRTSCERFGVSLNEMDLYRVRIDYPLVDSRLVLRVRSAPDPSPVKGAP